MKVLLIQPPQQNTIPFLTPNIKTKDIGIFPPLGLLSLASYIIHNSSHEVSVYDSLIEKATYKDVEKKIKSCIPDIVGITALTFTLVDVLKTAELVKQINPNILVCIGGPHIDMYPEETLSFPVIDFIVMGDGEKTFLQLVDALSQKKLYEQIPGVGYKANGKVIINSSSKDLIDLDTLPFPARKLLPYHSYWSLLSKKKLTTGMMTTRGCPYQCAFCCEHDLIYRKRSPEHVVQEMEECLRLGIEQFSFFDDTFTLDKKRVSRICALIQEKKLPVTFDIRTRVDVIDKDMISQLKGAGCETIRYGVESGSEETLKKMKKNITLDQIKDIFHFTKQRHITTFAYFMIGYPGETKEDIQKTIDFSLEIEPDYVQYSITTALPSTEIYRMGREKGLYQKDIWRDFALHPTSDFIPPVWDETCTRDELCDMMNNAYKQFYFRISYMIKNMMKIKSFDELKKKFSSAINIFFRR